jgi:hypothetical protein
MIFRLFTTNSVYQLWNWRAVLVRQAEAVKGVEQYLKQRQASQIAS